jgi:inhibitor of Bruton tyrosine kinase
MSHLLWKYYWNNDVDKFRRQLASASYSHPSKSPGTGFGSPGGFGSSPRALTKTRKVSGYGTSAGASRASGANQFIGKAEINSRDHAGLTILHRAASSASVEAVPFVEALLDHPAIDIFAQDAESGWNALHRALYAGNISIARLLLEKERKDLTESLAGNNATRVGQLIKTKDHEGLSPFDLYNATIALRSLKDAEDSTSSDDGDDSESDVVADENR